MPSDYLGHYSTMTSRKKPGVAFWATVVLVIVLLYPLSFGPVCWLCDRRIVNRRHAWSIYRPCIWLCVYGPKSVRLSIHRYVGWFGDKSLDFDNPGDVLWSIGSTGPDSPIEYEQQQAGAAEQAQFATDGP
jgi:hypothetical protein